MATGAARKGESFPGMVGGSKRTIAYTRHAPPINEEQWHTLVQLMLRGHTQGEAATMTGLNARSVRRYWTVGFPSQAWGKTPIRVLFEQARAKARAARQAEIDSGQTPAGPDLTPAEKEDLEHVTGLLGSATVEERKAATKDAIDARTSESQLVRMARGNVVILSGAAIGLLRPMKLVAIKVAKLVETAVADEKADAREGLKMLRETARILKDIVETGHRAMEMERLLLGDPSGGGKIVSTAATMTDDEVLTELGNASLIHRSLELRLIRGGRKDDAAASRGEGNAFEPSASRTAAASTERSASDERGTAGAGGAIEEPTAPVDGDHETVHDG